MNRCFQGFGLPLETVGDRTVPAKDHLYEPGMANKIPVRSPQNSAWNPEEEYAEEYVDPFGKEYIEVDSSVSQQHNLGHQN